MNGTPGKLSQRNSEIGIRERKELERPSVQLREGSILRSAGPKYPSSPFIFLVENTIPIDLLSQVWRKYMKNIDA